MGDSSVEDISFKMSQESWTEDTVTLSTMVHGHALEQRYRETEPEDIEADAALVTLHVSI